jgi:hypothetical protein
VPTLSYSGSRAIAVLLTGTTTPNHSRKYARSGSANSAASTAPLVRRSHRSAPGPFSSTLAKIFMEFRELRCGGFASHVRFTELVPLSGSARVVSALHASSGRR